ncbi:hypothetical protein ACJJIP_02810 [Microbulbifer sp. VTAC004]|uniref:hypothetical protein n=1 Tax=Microbulbifer sp. VTAC004 TaxID=3243386 RepID=UPI004039D973
MKALITTKLLLIALVCLACGVQRVSESLQPALIDEMSPQAHSELQRVVSQAMGGIQVTVGVEALTYESLLVVELGRKQMRSIGREYSRPTKFQLVSDGDRCLLERLTDGKLWELQVSCKLKSNIQ